MFQFQASDKVSATKAGNKRRAFSKKYGKTSKTCAKQLYRLAAIDLDGTLLSANKRISKENRAAVEMLLAKNIDVVLASGRKHDDIFRFHQELGLKSAILSCHGALVKEPYSGEVVSNRCIPKELVSFLLKDAQANGLSWVVYDDKGVHLCRSDYWLSEYIRRTDFDRPTMYDSIADYSLSHAQKVNWMGDEKAIRREFKRMHDLFAGRLTTVITDPDHLEFTLHGADKAQGLIDLTARLGIQKEEVLAFGDSNNDVTMLAWAGLGVAMSHGTSSAHLAAKMISAPGDEGSSLARAIDSIFSNAN